VSLNALVIEILTKAVEKIAGKAGRA
jgi:hypothetical protein